MLLSTASASTAAMRWWLWPSTKTRSKAGVDGRQWISSSSIRRAGDV
jgi:hypothetical protein